MSRILKIAAVLAGNLMLRIAATGQDADTSANATLLTKINVVDFAKPDSAWLDAVVGQGLAVNDRLRTGEDSRASARLSDLSILRFDELTTVVILPPKEAGTKATLDQKQGSSYFFSREKSREVSFQTPAANGAIRGTEFLLSVSTKKRTVVTMLGGQFALFNDFGQVVVGKGEQGQAKPGQKPTKCLIDQSRDEIPWFLLIESKLPPNKTIKTADQAELILALRAAVKQWPIVAAEIVKMAANNRPQMADKISRGVSVSGGGKRRVASPESPPGH